MRVIGIDPGLRNMGWGVIDVKQSRITHVANGICRSQGKDLAERLYSLFTDLEKVFQTFNPETAAVETTFVNKDGAATLKLGQARAVALLVPAKAGLAVSEYAPNKIKKAIVGVGHADKNQIAYMVKLQLPGIVLNGVDATDALAIALCHAYYGCSQDRLRLVVEKVL